MDEMEKRSGFCKALSAPEHSLEALAAHPDHPDLPYYLAREPISSHTLSIHSYIGTRYRFHDRFSLREHRS